MNISRLSIKSLTITILIIIGFFSVVVSFVSGEYFFKAAREAQVYSLNRVIQVATKEILQELHDQTYEIATALSIEGAIPKEFLKAAKSKSNEKLIKTLDDPFITGFVGAYIIELVKVRAYDLKLNLIAESNKGIFDLPKQLPETLYLQGQDRKGAARTKAINGLWHYAGKSYYSMLVPIGGVFIEGYLEIVVNPVNNLIKLSEKMDSPVTIRSGLAPNKAYYEPKESIANLLPIDFILKTNLGTPAYLLTSYEDIAKLSEGINKTVFNAIVVFIGLVLIVLLFAIGLFQLFLFKPMNMMLNEIRNITDGDIFHNLNIKGLSEITILSEEFNKMSKKIRAREEELTQLSVIDDLTKISNRRKFGEVLKHEYITACRTQKPLSVLMIDIDYFKLFNDTYGHLAGDDCIKKVATALQNSIYRPDDLVARYGGEEFVIILPDTPEKGEQVVAQKIMSEISRLNIPHSSSMINENITVSIGGYTLTPTIHHAPEFIVAEADKLLYQAKEAGRNQFKLHSES